MKKAKHSGLFLIAAVFTFTSCISLSIDIQMNRDGSGRLTMEYRISRALETLGALDGNAEMPAIPVSRSDWERTIERIKGVKIVSYSSSQKGQDTISAVVLEFSNPAALLALLDPDSSRASITADNNQNRFNLILNDGSPVSKYSDDYETMMEFARMMFSDYKFEISLSAPGNSTLTFTNGKGNEIPKPSPVEAVTSGRRVSMSIGIMDLIEAQDGIGVKFLW